MPTTTLTGETFLAVVTKSNLVDAERLKRAVEEFRATGGNADDAPAVADQLIAKSLITKWQAEKLLQGKHKGYFLSKYKLLSLLGKGGMSSVFLAEHTLMKRRCAIKVLPHKRVADSSYLARFHREAQAVASLDHPNIVRAYDVDHQNERDTVIHFLVMEYVDGQSLQELVARSGPCALADAVDYVRQAAVGLSHAHLAGLVHRDIKPGNLLRDQNGVVKILDLGLARFFDNQGQEEALTIQHDEKVLGTADYLAPEQALDSHSVDARADIYSLGCTLYFLLTGHPPFTEGTLTQRLMAHQTKEPSPVEKDRPDVPPSLTAIVRKMMAKTPDDRYDSAALTAEVMRKWLNSFAPPEWKKARRELFAGEATNRPAPVVAQVVAPGNLPPAPPMPPAAAKPVSPQVLTSPPVTGAPVSPTGPPSSNIFAFGPISDAGSKADTATADVNAAAAFAGIGASTGNSTAKVAAKPSKPANKPAAAIPKPKPAAAPPVKSKPAVAAVPAPSSDVDSETEPVESADFSFLSSPTTVAPAESPSGNGAFDFLGLSATVSEPDSDVPSPAVVAHGPGAAPASPAVESPPVDRPSVEAPPWSPATDSSPAGQFQLDDVNATPAVTEPPLTASKGPPSPTPARPSAKAAPAVPVTESKSEITIPAPLVESPAAIPSFNFTAPAPTPPVVTTPGAVVVVSHKPVTAVETPVDTVPPVRRPKPTRTPIEIPPALQDRRVQLGIVGGASVVVLVAVIYGFGLLGSTSTKSSVKPEVNKKSPAQQVASGGTTGNTTGGTASKSSEWAKKRTATVGGGGDFATLGDALQTVKRHFKPNVRSDRFTIKVAAGTYAERIVMDGKSWPKNITIRGEGGAVVLEPSGPEPIIKIAGLDGVQISNVLLKAQGKPVAIELSGGLAQMRLQKFTIQGFGEAGIHLRGGLGLSFADARCHIEEGQFESGANATGVKCTPSDGTDVVDTQNVAFQKLRFLGPLAAGITVQGKDVVNLEFRESIFSETKVGVQLLGKTGWRDFQFVNNTFYKCPNPVLVAEQPELSSKGVSFRRNLFVDSGPEVVIEKGFDEPQMLGAQMLGKNSLNFSSRAKPEGAKNELSIFGDGGQQGLAGVKFASTDVMQSKFLAPVEGSPQHTVGSPLSDEKPYVGAIAP